MIDGDIITYKCAFAAQRSRYYLMDGATQVASFRYKKDATKMAEENGLDIEKETVLEPVENALHIAKEMILRILQSTKAKDQQIYLTGEGNYREQIATIKPYKGNRAQERPIHYQAVRDYLISRFDAIVVDGIEADDKLGIEQWTDKEPTIICSIDKDLDMIPGWHYNWDKEEKYWIDEEAGYRNFYKQVLTGDTVDNIPGIFGLGKVTAEELLSGISSPREMEEVVLKQYILAYGDKAETILQEVGSLLWIQREDNQRWQLGSFS